MSKVYSEMELDLVTKGYIASIEKLKQANAKLKTDYEKKIEAMNRKNDAFMSSFKKMAGILAGVFSTQQIIAFGKEVVQLSGTMEGVTNAFNRLDDPALLNNLRKATHGTVSDLKLMSTAVQAKNLGIPIEHLATLFGFAASRARDTGESVDYLINSMALGLGRQSTLRLDNVGLSVKTLNEEIAKTGNFFTGAFKVINDEIAKAGEYAGTAADSMDRYKASIENFKASFAKSGVTSWIADELDEGAKMVETLGSKYFSFWQKLGFVFRDNWEQLDKIKKVQEDILNKAKEAPAGYNPLLNGGVAGKLGIGQGWSMLSGASGAGGSSIKTIGDLRKELQELEAEVDSLNIKDTAAIRAHLAKIEAIKKQIKALTELNTKVSDLVFGDDYNQNQVKAASEWEDFLSERQKASKDEEIAYWQAQVQAAAEYETFIAELTTRTIDYTEAINELQGVMGSLIRSSMDGWESFGETFKNVFKDLMAKLLTLIATYTVLNLLGFRPAMSLGNFISQGFGVIPKTGGEGSGPIGGVNKIHISGRDMVGAVNRSGNVMFKNT